MEPDSPLSTLPRRAKARSEAHRKALRRLPHRKVDETLHALHDAVFAQTNCLTCANCCRTTSPILWDADIARLAKHLRLKEAVFMDKFLQRDTDGDWVFNQAPCPFLQADNTCSVYDYRPRACREYPHTDRKQQAGLYALTLRNAAVCPAVFDILERLSSTAG
ncbi:MAG: YkgJ family cysteine cluster protein [Bacteroidetes bacterium]|nr:YkgJ family cysteine cluster protein [Bacteroidota bacterium]